MRKFNKSVNQIIAGGSGGGPVDLGDLVSTTIYADVDDLEIAFPALSNIGKLALVGSTAADASVVYADADLGWLSENSIIEISWPNPTDGAFIGQWGIENGQLAYRWYEVKDGIFTWVPATVLSLGEPLARVGPILGTEDSAADWQAAGADTIVLDTSGGASASILLTSADGYAQIAASNGGVSITPGANFGFYNSGALTSSSIVWCSIEMQVMTINGSASLVGGMLAAQSDNPFRAWRVGREQSQTYLQQIGQTGEEVLPTAGNMGSNRVHMVSIVDSTRARAWINGRLCLDAARSSMNASSIYPRIGPYGACGTGTAHSITVRYYAGSVWGIAS